MTVTNVTPPVITGTPQQGRMLQASNGTWTHDLDYLTYAYQWERCDAAGANCVDVAGAIASNYTLAAADVGHTMRIEVTATENEPPVATGDRYAAPNGSDLNQGTLAQPYKTVAKLLQSLVAGETGMLRAGTYGSYTTWHGDPANNGTSSDRITLTNYPGEKATIVGYFTIPRSYWTIKNLYFNTTNIGFHPSGPQPLDLNGPNMIFEYNDVYQDVAVDRGNLILLGAGGSGRGDNTIIRFNRIHDCGKNQRQDHCIYHSGGNACQVYGNWMWNNPAGWGIQCYPGPSNALYHSNVIDMCASGLVVSGDTGFSCLDNTFYNNVVINSTGLSFTGGCGMSGTSYPTNSGNVMRDNCCFNNPGGVRGELEGYTWCADVSVSGNITVNPNLQNVAAHDYRTTGSTPAAVLAYGLPTTTPGPSV